MKRAFCVIGQTDDEQLVTHPLTVQAERPVIGDCDKSDRDIAVSRVQQIRARPISATAFTMTELLRLVSALAAQYHDPTLIRDDLDRAVDAVQVLQHDLVDAQKSRSRRLPGQFYFVVGYDTGAENSYTATVLVSHTNPEMDEMDKRDNARLAFEEQHPDHDIPGVTVFSLRELLEAAATLVKNQDDASADACDLLRGLKQNIDRSLLYLLQAAGLSPPRYW